jgi:hypothetical protein
MQKQDASAFSSSAFLSSDFSWPLFRAISKNSQSQGGMVVSR